MTETPPSWHELSRRRLEEALGELRCELEERIRGASADDSTGRGQSRRAAPMPDSSPPDRPAAVDRLIAKFDLTTFERDLLLLCAGFELDGRFGALLAEHQGSQGFPSQGAPRPTFAVALALLDDGHWSAISPTGVLRRGRLLTVAPGPGLASSPLVIEEAVLHELIGLPQLDERLRPLLDPVPLPEEGDTVFESQARTASRLVAAWSDASRSERPVVQLVGGEPAADRTVVAAACCAVGLGLFALDPAILPDDPAAAEEILALWERDAVLHDFALLVELGDGTVERPIRRWIERLHGFLVLSGSAPAAGLWRSLVRIDAEPPQPTEQRRLWAAELGPLAADLDGQLDALIRQFPLSPGAVREVVGELRGLTTGSSDSDVATEIWRLCRRRARGGLDALAQRLEPMAEWDELVLPAPQKETLERIVVHVRRRARVYDDWGFAAKSRRGLGISALFAGPSGTGKTMAAEVLARSLDLDLYRIDLSSIISKYIGETEKNLRRLFDAADQSGAILLFDEADALFGKRSEVRNSHDRYANLEVSYLLQRIETYRGLAILTSNFKEAIDQAFVRRLRFVVHFPFPTTEDRRRIWSQIFPPSTPTDGLDVDRLARLSVAGGHIRNIALGAAFLAADQDRSVTMADLLEAARAELAKSGQAASEAQLEGWT